MKNPKYSESDFFDEWQDNIKEFEALAENEGGLHHISLKIAINHNLKKLRRIRRKGKRLGILK